MTLHADSPALQWLATGCFRALLQQGGKAWRQTNGGISSFQFSESLNAEVQTFLVPETCNLTARRWAGWWILREVVRVYLWREVAAWCCVFSPEQWVRTLMSECCYCFFPHSLKWRTFSSSSLEFGFKSIAFFYNLRRHSDPEKVGLNVYRWVSTSL